jgi:hypothetical protein
MTDPRATARQWLAGRHAEAFNKCWHSHSCGEPCSACLVEAILTAPGVEVELDRIKRLPKEAFEDRPVEIRNPRSPIRITHTQVVIRLPAEEAT